MITYLHFNSLSSTHDYAEVLVKEKRPKTPYVITTDFQQNGQGTQNRSWYAEKKTSLLYTLVFYSEKPEINTKNMVITAAKTIQTMLKKDYKINCEIKKPNDIHLNKKKCGGILIKNIIQGTQCWTLIGIGLNINTKAFPKNLEPIATSLYQATGKTLNIKSLYPKITKNLIQSYAKIMYN